MQQDELQENKFKFRLKDVLVPNFRIFATPAVDPDSGIASIEFAYNFTFDFDENIATCKMHFKYFLATDLKDLTNGQTNVLLADIHYFFQVLDLAQFVKEHDNKQTLDTGILLNLVNVAYSTSRGILYDRTRGYGINNLLLPVLNLEEYIKDVTFISETATSSTVFSQPA